MAYRTLEITLTSAKDLKNVNLFSRMEVYAVASLSGDPRLKKRTPPDREGGRNPNWNSTLRFKIPASDPGPLVLRVLLRTKRFLGDRDVGEVYVSLRELLGGAGAGPLPIQFVSYQVRKPSSRRARGVLNFSYRIDAATSSPYTPMADPIAVHPVTAYPPSSKPTKDEPVTAYPVSSSSAVYPPPPASAGYPPYGAPSPYGYAAPTAGYGYPPAGYGYPPAGYGYGAPPPTAGYGYPPAGYGYGAPPPARKNKFGMGMGAGLLGGALGGLLIGDMVSDAGGFDF